MKEVEMGGVCRMDRGDEKGIHNFGCGSTVLKLISIYRMKWKLENK
jgi:hypothetical protein